LSDKFAAAGERVRKHASTENFVATFTDGFRQEINPQAVAKAAATAGFQDVWLDGQKKKKKAFRAGVHYIFALLPPIWCTDRRVLSCNGFDCLGVLLASRTSEFFGSTAADLLVRVSGYAHR
jgi:hypothetical protein